MRPESSNFDLKSCSALQKGSTRGSGSRGKGSFRVVVLPDLDVPEAGPVLVGIFAIQTFLFGIGSHDDGTATISLVLIILTHSIARFVFLWALVLKTTEDNCRWSKETSKSDS